jgi:hypothetical protein
MKRELKDDFGSILLLLFLYLLQVSHTNSIDEL